MKLTHTGQSTTVNGQQYEVYTDEAGNRYLRDPRPPHSIVPESQLRSANPSRDLPVPMPARGAGIVNRRQTTRPARWDFHGESYASLCTRTGIDRLSASVGVRQTFAGANLLSFDPATLDTHVVYAMRQDLGFPDLQAHPDLRYEIQLLPGPSPSKGFLSIAIEGDVRDVARYLLEQGVVRLDGIPIEHADQVYALSATIDGRARTLTLWYGQHALRAIAIDR